MIYIYRQFCSCKHIEIFAFKNCNFCEFNLTVSQNYEAFREDEVTKAVYIRLCLTFVKTKSSSDFFLKLKKFQF